MSKSNNLWSKHFKFLNLKYSRVPLVSGRIVQAIKIDAFKIDFSSSFWNKIQINFFKLGHNFSVGPGRKPLLTKLEMEPDRTSFPF